jgi:uncharacterized membrane protein YqjE
VYNKRKFWNAGGESVQYVNAGMFVGLAFWFAGFALMTAGWLIDVVFEKYGAIPAKILYKTGAVLVASPIIFLLWKVADVLYANRFDIVVLLRGLIQEGQRLFQEALSALSV